MGTVHLTNGHQGLMIRNCQTDLSKRVALDRELLSRHMYFDATHPAIHPYCGMVSAALEALMDLRGFNAAVSHHVLDVAGVQHIEFPHREWCEITLGTPENVVVDFSHDSRYDNHPFRRMTGWLEEEGPREDFTEADWAKFYSEWSSAKKWKDFFERRIRREIDELKTEADKLSLEAQNLTDRAEAIQTALEQQTK